ncbi:putative leucine-rich repeat-containing protein DDB_G0290503 [Prorops nasuta]|uniref:putative leucine-rich repeat-containing protein DDB_G0290503 n=1 Tax=Prorops nasuta TaxID=863751 RepID=UPI0034CDE0C6
MITRPQFIYCLCYMYCNSDISLYIDFPLIYIIYAASIYKINASQIGKAMLICTLPLPLDLVNFKILILMELNDLKSRVLIKVQKMDKSESLSVTKELKNKEIGKKSKTTNRMEVDDKNIIHEPQQKLTANNLKEKEISMKNLPTIISDEIQSSSCKKIYLKKQINEKIENKDHFSLKRKTSKNNIHKIESRLTTNLKEMDPSVTKFLANCDRKGNTSKSYSLTKPNKLRNDNQSSKSESNVFQEKERDEAKENMIPSFVMSKTDKNMLYKSKQKLTTNNLTECETPMRKSLSEYDYKRNSKESDSLKNSSIIRKEKENNEKIEVMGKTVKKLELKCKGLLSENISLKRHMNKKDLMTQELSNINIQLQNKIIDEYPKINELNQNIQTTVLSNFDQLMYKYFCMQNVIFLSEQIKNNPMITLKRIGELPVGYRNSKTNEIYLGYGVNLPVNQYDTICVISKTIGQFVKNVAIALFGIQTLKENSVTDAISNRNKNKKGETPRPALDPKLLQALRGIVKYYVMSEKGLCEVSADYEVQQVGTHLAHKIYELNNPRKRKSINTKLPNICSGSSKPYTSNEVNNNECNNGDKIIDDRMTWYSTPSNERDEVSAKSLSQRDSSLNNESLNLSLTQFLETDQTDSDT